MQMFVFGINRVTVNMTHESSFIQDLTIFFMREKKKEEIGFYFYQIKFQISLYEAYRVGLPEENKDWFPSRAARCLLQE